MNWLTFALMTVVSWGLYGIFLHNGQTSMLDKDNALYKSFLFVGLAYFLTAVLAPLAILVSRKANWNFPAAGMGWSLVAGIVGAIGAFCVLLAFAADGKPGAPVVNAVVALALHPPPGGYGSIKWQFYTGILMAALGGFMVTKFKPAPAAPKKSPAVVASAGASSQVSRH
jgi:hypothetical protein